MPEPSCVHFFYVSRVNRTALKVLQIHFLWGSVDSNVGNLVAQLLIAKNRGTDAQMMYSNCLTISCSATSRLKFPLIQLRIPISFIWIDRNIFMVPR